MRRPNRERPYPVIQRQLAADIIFGARALLAVEGRFAVHLLDSWSSGTPSLLNRPLS